MYRQTSKQKETRTHRHTHPDIQKIHRQTQVNRQADRQTHTSEYIMSNNDSIFPIKHILACKL